MALVRRPVRAERLQHQRGESGDQAAALRRARRSRWVARTLTPYDPPARLFLMGFVLAGLAVRLAAEQRRAA